MFSKIPVMKVLVLLCFIAATSAAPIFFGHPKQTQIFITPRKDTVSSTVNQIPATLVKARPALKLNVPVHVPPMPVQVPVIGQVNVPQANTHVSTPHEMNKLFNEMKNSKKPFMTITMKAPAKSSSLFPDPFSLFEENNEHIVVHVPYNVHTHNIHHHHIQTVPIYKHVPVVKHVPYVKEVAIPIHLDHQYNHGWAPAPAQWW
ncbi:uncharacterized protein LOC129578024 [Sitodiplosis mosellana]|uniref:uncharacterized protein LOC129578024 n=1 Tax=Sitodiplosis mosellana TaxID=263140 RepID=UPI00244410CC|nr:uncharacterized protein LOC129578024 [Sitodiplosis mosellana]